MRSAILSFGFVLFLVSVTAAQSTATIKVEVQGIKSDEGMLRVGLYDSAHTWLEKVFKSESTPIVNGKCEVVFADLPFGEYGISVYHDENNNGELDKFLGFYPKEDYACSNQAPANYGPPKWKDAKFTINQKSNQQLIKL